MDISSLEAQCNPEYDLAILDALGDDIVQKSRDLLQRYQELNNDCLEKLKQYQA